MLYCKLCWNHIVFWSLPTLPESYYSRLGKIHFELNNYRKAISQFEKSESSYNLQDVSFSKYNWYYLGYCYLNLGDFKNAVKYFEKYLKFNLHDYETLSEIGWCYALLNESELALKAYLQLLKHEPNALEIHLNCIEILSHLGRKDEALKLIEGVVSEIEDPMEKGLIESLSLKMNGDIVSAIKKLNGAINMSSNSLCYYIKADLQIALSRMQKESGDLKGGLNTLKVAFENNSNDLWLINELAVEYADQDIKLEDALNLINYALDFQPDNSLFLDTKGWILYKTGKVGEAKKNLERCLSLNPKNEDIQKHHKTIANA
ncbi:MAG: tetratricopeptide repeat protein [Desulfobacteraceae bacterium]|nr:tetratricopeptide repeat protein [Desulfobacteraceae bacterium]